MPLRERVANCEQPVSVRSVRCFLERYSMAAVDAWEL